MPRLADAAMSPPGGWTRRLTCALLALAGLAATSTSGLAVEAAFSADGNFVYYFKRWDSAKANEPIELIELDLAKRTTRSIDLSRLKPPGGFIAIDHWANGLLLLTGRTLYAFDPRSGEFSTLCVAPDGEGFEDVAADAATGNILITGFIKPERPGNVGFYYLGSEKRLLLVTARRIQALECPTFAPDGLLFFGVRGDLWAGKIEVDSESETERPELAFVEAVRVGPLASLETGNFTPAQEGVRGVAVARDSIYVITYRMGGSGHGHLVKLPALSGPVKTLADFSGTVATYGRLLAEAKVVESADFQRMPCASQTGDQIFFGGAGRDLVILRVADDRREVVGQEP